MTVSRDFYYEVDTRGQLTLDGMVQTDPWFLDFFYRRLASTANPHYPEHPYVSRCGDEMNYLRPADTPIVYTGFDGTKLTYAHSLHSMFRPDRLGYSNEGVLYHKAPIGTWGRIVPQIAMEIARFIEPWGHIYAFNDASARRLVPLEPFNQLEEYSVIRPREDNACIACGEANPYSLQLSFLKRLADGHITTYITPDIRLQGSLGIVHGGFVSLLLDETMGKCLSAIGVRAPTASLNVSFRNPMELGQEYEVRAWMEEQRGRKNFLRGQIVSTRESSNVVADANALFITIGQKPSA